MRTRWESPADDPDLPACDVDEECEGGDDCALVNEGPEGCVCACHKEPDEPDGYQSEADLQAITDHYYPV